MTETSIQRRLRARSIVNPKNLKCGSCVYFANFDKCRSTNNEFFCLKHTELKADWRPITTLFEPPVFEDETEIIVTDGTSYDFAIVKGFHIFHNMSHEITNWMLAT